MTGGSEADAHTDLPMATSAPHGFCDDEATRHLLRSRPPHQALAWAETVLGVPVVSARFYGGHVFSRTPARRAPTRRHSMGRNAPVRAP